MNRKSSFISFAIFIGLLFFCVVVLSCKNKDFNHHGNNLDTLKVVTLYGPLSFFDYRDDTLGIDYENVRRFAKEHEMVLSIHTVSNVLELIENLKHGKAHLAAYPVPLIAEYNKDIKYCGPFEISNQVLVQRKGNNIKDVTELINKEIYVEKDSKYEYRLRNLNDELGGGIIIHYLESDTLSTEDLLKMVDSNHIDYTIIDSQTAGLYNSIFPTLDMTLQVSSDQPASWAVAQGLDSLAAKIDRWENRTHSNSILKDIYKNYYDRALSEDFDINLTFFKKKNFLNGEAVSPFDNTFKKYSHFSGYDWKLLAAITFCESRFNPSVESRFGATGLMQVMPSTAEAMGENPANLNNPDANVRVGAKLLAKLDKLLQNKVPNENERMKFVIAAYNAGLGHIYDAMALAEKNGMDPQKWNGNVSICALLKSRPEYYNDPVVKNGYFRGRETVNFVDHVTSIYDYLNEQIK